MDGRSRTNLYDIWANLMNYIIKNYDKYIIQYNIKYILYIYKCDKKGFPQLARMLAQRILEKLQLP